MLTNELIKLNEEQQRASEAENKTAETTELSWTPPLLQQQGLTQLMREAGLICDQH